MVITKFLKLFLIYSNINDKMKNCLQHTLSRANKTVHHLFLTRKMILMSLTYHLSHQIPPIESASIGRHFCESHDLYSSCSSLTLQALKQIQLWLTAAREQKSISFIRFLALPPFDVIIFLITYHQNTKWTSRVAFFSYNLVIN